MKSSSGPPSAFTRSGVRTSIKSRPPKRQRCEISKTIQHHPVDEICFRCSIPKHCKHGNTPWPYLSFDFKWCFKVVVLGLSLSLHTPIKNLLRGWSHPSWPNCLHPTRLASWGVSHHQPQGKLIWENSRMVEPSPGVLKVPQNWNFCMLEPMHHTDFTNYPRYISWQSFIVSSLQKSSLSKAWCNHWFLSCWKSTWDSPTHLCFEVVELHSLIPGFFVNVVHRRPCCEIGLKWDAWDTTKTHATWTWWEKMWFASVALQ